MSEAENMYASSAQASINTGKCEIPKETTLELSHEFGTGSVSSEPSKQKHRSSSEDVHIEPAETSSTISNHMIIEQSGPTMNGVPEDNALEHAGPPPENMTKNSNNEELGSTVEDVTKNDFLEDTGHPTDMTVNSITEDMGSSPKDMPNNSLAEHKGPVLEDATKDSDNGVMVPLPEDANKNSNNSELGSPPKVAPKSSSTKQLGPTLAYEMLDTSIKRFGPPIEDAAKNSTPQKLKAQCKDENSVSQLVHRNERTSAKSSKRKHTKRSVGGSDRVLRSKSQEKPEAPEPSNNVADVSAGKEKKRKKRKKVQKISADEFSRIRTNFRYLLHRMSYEQNLIDVYSGEGWKRQSVDKLKPEKELQRAASEIFRCKLKIRDVFQRLDSICAEGRFPESLFDSDGQIDSEDIFCAKCGSKDLSDGNDIILCDGACDRGFHLLCLQPPMSLEEIPPDDEGWLCPGCDCKVDCIDLLNDSQGTTLSITDSWEMVFPEAAASPGANMQDAMLPSDDSEDDDYDPAAKAVDEKLEEDDSSSDDSDFTSASDELGAPANDEQFLGLPSDDSEDDDYNPIAPDLDEQVNQNSSSSDFTSDSEDLDAALDNNRSSGKGGGPSCSSSNHKRPLSEELLTITESVSGQADLVPVSGRRHVERLDYKKLYDEAYTNVISSSSDDDDWTDTAALRKRKNRAGQVAQGSPSGYTSSTKVKKVTRDAKHSLKETELSSNRRNRQKLNLEATNNSPVKLQKGSPSPGKKTPYRRLGEAATQRLYTSFKENQYPDRAAKGNLAEELGMTAYQISKWFENARWSSRHHPSGTGARAAKSAQDEDITSPQNNEQLDPETKMNARDVICNGFKWKESAVKKYCSEDEREKEVASKETNVQKSSTPNSKKRKNKSNLSSEETPKPTVNSPYAHEAETRGRIKTRSRKSAS